MGVYILVKIPYALGFKIYKKSPFWLQNIFNLALMPIPRSFMLGSGFHEKFSFLLKSEKWSYDELIEFQEKKLKKLIKHVYKNVPYYQKIFKERHLHPNDIKKIEDLNKLPILTKNDIRDNFSDLIAINYKEYKPGLAYTSGTTGKPLEFYLDQQNREIEYACVWRQVYWSGVKNLNAKVATFRGDFVYNYGKSNSLYKYHGLHKELIFNSYHLKPEHIKKIICKLNNFKPDIIRGYPHVLYIVAKISETDNIKIAFKPKIIQTSSEQLTLNMRKKIEEIFNCKIFDYYGQSEYVVSMNQCEFGTYHQNMETGILNVVIDINGFMRVIGTGLWNYSMPFINYEIGDLVTLDKHNTCRCGRRLLNVKSIEGRLNDIIVTSTGKAISGVGFEHFWKHRVVNNLSVIPEYIHFCQENFNKLTVEVYSQKEFSNEDKDLIFKELNFLFEKNIEIEIKYLDNLPDNKKWRLVESKVNFDAL